MLKYTTILRVCALVCRSVPFCLLQYPLVVVVSHPSLCNEFALKVATIIRDFARITSQLKSKCLDARIGPTSRVALGLELLPPGAGLCYLYLELLARGTTLWHCYSKAEDYG